VGWRGVSSSKCKNTHDKGGEADSSYVCSKCQNEVDKAALEKTSPTLVISGQAK